MTFVPYIQASEMAAFGIVDADDFQVAAACRAVNAYIGRPEGLIWSPDGNGAPCFMENMTALRSLGTGASLTPGLSAQVNVPGSQLGNSSIGDVVIIDRLVPATTEACVITAVSGDILTLQNVQFNHLAGATVEFGLTLLEDLHLRRGIPKIWLNRCPVARLHSASGRMGFSKPPVQITDMPFGVEAALYSLAGGAIPNAWSQLDISQWDINYNTGAITVYPYALAGGSNDLRLRYVAGWPIGGVPDNVKQAVANIVRSALDTPFSANMKVLKAGDGTLERFSPSIIDADTRALLQPLKSMRA